MLIDPGIGFGKTAEHNRVVVRRFAELSSARPDRHLSEVVHRQALDLPINERMEGTAATVTAAVLRGADVVGARRRSDDARCARRRSHGDAAHDGGVLGAPISDAAQPERGAPPAASKARAYCVKVASLKPSRGAILTSHFLNKVIEIRAGTARELLAAAKSVEREGGRTPTRRWGPRSSTWTSSFGDERISEPGGSAPPGIWGGSSSSNRCGSSGYAASDRARVGEAVADARHRKDVVGPRRLRLDLPSQVPDVDVDDACLDRCS